MVSVADPRSASARRRRRLLLAGLLAIVLVVVIVLVANGGGPPPLPPAGIAQAPGDSDPFAYSPSRQSDFASRATAGSSQVLFTKSPGGASATAARVASFAAMIDAAAARGGIDPRILGGIVFVESAGRPDAIVGGDPSGAAGLTQILPQTGQALLGMRIDLAQSRRLTAAIGRASLLGEGRTVQRLEARRARVDDRFDPAKALAATVRYLKLGQARLGRFDLAVVSYHMGIGNLQRVLADYNGGHAVPYVQLYFDTSPDRHRRAYSLLSGFGDDSSLYLWRVLGAEQVMRLYRSDRAALNRLTQLETAYPSNAEVLDPPGRTPLFADPGALAQAYASHTLMRLPQNAAQLGLAYDPAMGSLASHLGATAALYQGLRPAALELLLELAARVRALAGSSAPLTIATTVSDARYQRLSGSVAFPAATGYSFEIVRRYASAAQAAALQAMLDRLQALDLIAWLRTANTIEVTVASGAAQTLATG